MNDVMFVSDQHFHHKNFLGFKNDDGSACRDFATIEEMDEFMIENHNRVVHPHQKVYFLGDVAFDLKAFHRIMPRLNGKKRLIMGNHDKFRPGEYAKYFYRVQESWQPLRNLIFTHRPIYLGEMNPDKIILNCHGHTHQRNIPDDRYLNICVEKTNYTPVSFDWIIAEYEKRGFKI